MKNPLGVALGVSFVLYAAGTFATRADVPEMPLAPCEHVIMMSAPDADDGGVLAYCAGSQFFYYDQEDGHWSHMSIVHIRGTGPMPVCDEYAMDAMRHADLIGDHRAVGMYE